MDTVRVRLLETTFHEVLRSSFQKTSLSQILKKSDVSKGGFYHYFSSKSDLGVALITEVHEMYLQERWLKPLAKVKSDPIKQLIQLFDNNAKEISQDGTCCGCPINNLSQEMSSLDENMRRALVALSENWVSGFQNFIYQAQKKGLITKDLKAKSIATFLVSFCGGTIGLVKTRQNLEIIQQNKPTLIYFLESLRS